ncbi:MAG: YdcF family protein [Verrucomicrobiales bacterium]|nr:YdcF family protein [Verrucomicrobiales bacterium]
MDYWFSVKKLLSIYLNPVTVTLELVFLGVVLIGLASRKPRKPLGPKMTRLRAHLGDLGVFFVILGILALFFASVDPVANALTLHLERQHPPLEERDGVTVVTTAPAAIVVLAGGQRNAPEKPVLSSLTRQGLARIVGGVDLWKHFPDSKFIVTGHPDETSAMRAVAQRLGVPADRIVEETESRDTKDHPRKLKPLLGESPFLLVTSGTHMPRSAALFRAAGYDPILAAVDLQIWPTPGVYDPYRPGLFIPRVAGLELTSTALHEIAGLAWSRWLGEVK